MAKELCAFIVYVIAFWKIVSIACFIHKAALYCQILEIQFSCFWVVHEVNHIMQIIVTHL